MAQIVKLKRTSVAGRIPTTSNIEVGELAFNSNDKSLFIRGDSNAIVAIHDESTLHIDTTNNRIGIGTTSPNRKLEVSFASTVYGARFTRNDAAGSSLIEFANNAGVKSIIGYDAGVVGYKIGTASATNLVVKQSGNVGIGTVSPASTLHIIGTNNAAGGITLGGPTEDNSAQKVGRIKTAHYSTSEEPFTAILTNAQATSNLINIGGASGAENAATLIKFFTASNTTTLTGSERVRIDSSGNFTIKGSNADLTLGSSGNDITFNRNSDNYINAQAGTSSNIVINPENRFVVNTSDTERLRVDSAGRVGIGTTSPGQKLEVAGRVRATTDPTFEVFESTSKRGGIQWNSTSDYLNIFTVGGHISLSGNGNNVGIDTTSPGRKLDVSSGGSDVPQIRASYDATNYLDLKHNLINAVSSGGNDALLLQTAGTTGLMIDVNQRVGIGTTSPDTNLDLTSSGVHGLILNQDTSNTSASSRIFFKDGTRTNTILNVSGNLEFRTGATIGSSSGTKRLVVKGNGTITFNEAYTFPASDGSANQVLQTDGSGNLSFATVQAGGGGTVSEAFKTIAVSGQDNVVADAATDTLTFAAGAGMTITTNASSDTVTFAASSSDFEDSDGDTKIQVEESSDEDIIRFDTAGTERMTLSPSVLSVRGTSNPEIELLPNGSVGNADLRFDGTTFDLRSNSSSASLLLSTSSTERMRITASGSVSIGTTTATGAGGLLVDNDIKTNSRVGIGSTGSASAPALYLNSDTDTGVYFPTANTLGFVTGGVERGRFESDGSFVINNSGGDAQLYLGGSSGTSRMYLARSGLDSLLYNVSNGNLRFGTNNTERARLTSDGKLLIGTTSSLHSSADLQIQGASGNYARILLKDQDGTNQHAFIDETGGNLVFTSQNGTSHGPIRFATYNGTDTTERMRVHSNGNVGIGTASPSKPLHVQFSGDHGARIESEDNHASLYVDSHTGYGQYIRFSEENSNKYWIQSTGGKLVFRPAATSTAANQVIFDASGRVGIGITAPTYPLVVQSDSTAAAINIIGRSSDSISQLDFDESDGTLIAGFQARTTDFRMRTVQNLPLLFMTNNTERMRVDTGGRLLIGTTSTTPGFSTTNGHAFHVGDASHISRDQGVALIINRGTNDGGIAQFRKSGTFIGQVGTINQDSNTNMFIAFNNGSSDVGLGFGHTSGTGRAYYPCRDEGSGVSAAIDLGTSTYKYKDLHLSGSANIGTNILMSNATTSAFMQVSSNILQFGTSSNDPLAFFTNNTEAGRFDTSGNLSIGTNSFDSGNITSTGTINMNHDSATLFLGADIDMRIKHDGSNGTIQNDTGDLTLDLAGKLVLDADDGGIIDLMDGGTRFGRLQNMIGGLGISAGSTPTFQQLLSSTKTLFFGHIEVGDNKHIQVGSGNGDFKIIHDGSNTNLEAFGTGNLIIKQSTDDADIVFQSDDGSGGTTTYFSVDGGEERVVFNKWTRHIDNTRILVGTGGDLAIYHDGSNSHIKNTTGDLIIQNDGDDVKILAEDDVVIRDNDDSTEMAKFINGGAVELYHNGVKKFETISSGINVTGTAEADAITSTGLVKLDYTNPTLTFRPDNSAHFNIKANESPARLELGHSTNVALHLSNTGNATFNNDLTVTGNLTVNGTTTTLNTATLDVEDKNITLNKGSGDTSGSADGAGITIQDAVDSSTDATILWNQSISGFKFSHDIRLDDSIRLEFGDDSDLVIRHLNNNRSYITGNDIEIGTNSFRLFNLAGTTGMITATTSGVNLLQNTSVTGSLSVTGNISSGIYEIGDDVTSTSSTTQTTISQFSASSVRSCRFTVQVTNNTDSTYHTSELLLVHDGTTPGITEFGTIFTGAAAEATFDADISSGSVRLRATPASSDSMTFKVVRHMITT